MRRVALGNTHYFKFTTRNFSTGAPYTLAGTPVISIYEENNLTQITAGVTLTVDYDTVTGLNSVAVAATSGNGYSVGKTYAAVITTGTVNSVSVVGEVVDQFEIVPTESVTGYPKVDTAYLAGTAQTARDIGASVLLSAGTGTGQISLTSGAVTAGTVSDKTGYSISGTKTTLDALNDITVANILDATIASYITAGTVGEAIALGSAAIVDTTITGTPTTTTIQLTAGSTLDNFYNDQIFYILSGTGIGQAKVVESYTGATKTITVDEAFVTIPAAGDRIAIIVGHAHAKSQIRDAILADSTAFNGADIATIKAGVPTAAQLAYIVANAATGLPVTFSGTGTTTTGTLALVDGATPSAVTDQYKGRLLVFNAGTLNQAVTDITGYNGTTKVVTVTAVPVAIDSTHTARLI